MGKTVQVYPEIPRMVLEKIGNDDMLEFQRQVHHYETDRAACI
jgi:hypothetical protein